MTGRLEAVPGRNRVTPWTLLACLAATGALGGDAVGQAAAGAVPLELRPHSADTLRLRLDQTIEIWRGVPRSGKRTAASDVAAVVVRARLVIQSVDPGAATVIALTDSVRVIASEPFDRSSLLVGVRSLQGKRVPFRIAPDGASALALATSEGLPMSDRGPAADATGAGSLFSQLPATLPRTPMLPGASWTRTLEIPLSATLDAGGAGREGGGTRETARLDATFVFDSLSRSGERAYLSVDGRVRRDGTGLNSIGGAETTRITTGEVTGVIVLDRRRGWIAEARSVVTLESEVVPTSRGARERAGTRSRVKITQWMRVL